MHPEDSVNGSYIFTVVIDIFWFLKLILWKYHLQSTNGSHISKIIKGFSNLKVYHIYDVMKTNPETVELT
jgi:hypothetical protein